MVPLISMNASEKPLAPVMSNRYTVGLPHPYPNRLSFTSA
jgi:hypothetical protein